MGQARQQTRSTITAVAGGDPAASVTGGNTAAVCVIGAGAAGLAAGRLLRDEGLHVTILEKSLHVGGVWRYNAGSGEKAPMYRSLVTNLPKQGMSYLGFPFAGDLQSFNTHGQVLDYLGSYADEYKLHPMISLGCTVEAVRPVTLPAAREGQGTPPGAEQEKALGKWEVVYHRKDGASAGADASGADAAATATCVTELFDAVCVCSGHFDQAFTPWADGLDGFRGTSMHAREYDRPGVEAFVGKRVLCIGSGSSGSDIAREVSSVAAVVHVADRKNLETLAGGGERGNVCWRPAVERFEGDNGVRFKSGELEEVDTVVWCTGYNYYFPYLEDSGLLTPPSSQRIHPLYEQLFHVQHPSLSFIGLPQNVAPFPMFEVQANAVAAAISGRSCLPSLAEREQWLLDEENGLRERSVNPASRGAHVLGDMQWGYLRRLLRMAGGPGLVARGPPQSADAAAGEGDVEGEPEADLQGLLEALSVREAVWNDVSACRPTFPGGADDYRRREYHVDWDTGAFSVSYAARKANGEGPSQTCWANDTRRSTKDPRELKELVQFEGLRQLTDGPCA